MKKPPIGIKPDYILNSERISEINNAISRYINACVPIPEAWILERNERIKWEEARSQKQREPFLTKEEQDLFDYAFINAYADFPKVGVSDGKEKELSDEDIAALKKSNFIETAKITHSLYCGNGTLKTMNKPLTNEEIEVLKKSLPKLCFVSSEESEFSEVKGSPERKDMKEFVYNGKYPDYIVSGNLRQDLRDSIITIEREINKIKNSSDLLGKFD